MKSEATYAGDPRYHHSDITRLRAMNKRLRAEAREDYARAEIAENQLMRAREEIAALKIGVKPLTEGPQNAMAR